MAKRKVIPVIKRSVGKDGRVRFFVKGTNKQISNKNNAAARAFIKQDFRRLVSSPSAQETLTPFELLSLENTRRAIKGRDKSSEASQKRFRIKGKVVSRAIQKTIEFNPELKRLFENMNINSQVGFENLKTQKEVIDKLSTLLDEQIQRIIPKTSSAIIDNNYWINEDRTPRTEKDFSGTFNKLVEVLNIMPEIDAQSAKTRPPSILKVITRNGDTLFGQQAREELERFVAETTRIQFEKDDDKTGVAVKFFFPYKVIFPDKGAPELIIDLNRFDEDDEDYFQFEGSEKPLANLRRSA